MMARRSNRQGAMRDFDALMSRGGEAAVANATRFFMRDDPVNRALRAIAARLRELQIPYAVCGGMALVAHGYDRTTVDVDLLLTGQGLQAAHAELEALGYVPPFAGSKNLRDVTTGVRIEFLVAGQFPGDGKPKPVAFPDPAAASIEIDGVRYLKLPNLIELKLASGMTNPGRLKDLADVQELIRVLKLKRDFAGQLNEYVRPTFEQLWDTVRQDERPQE
jgi:hypothetical protein